MNDFDAPWTEHRDELYDRVVRRGRTLQWQRRAIAGTVAAIVLVIPLAAHAAVTGPSGHVQVTASSTTTEPGRRVTTTTRESSTTSTTTATPPNSNPSGGTTPSPTSAPIAPKSCLNSHDPACGPFRWDGTAPTNPFVVLQSPAHVTVAVGEPVAVRFGMDGTGHIVTWDDGDYSQWGTFILPSECDGLGPMYGPWTLPATPNADNVKTEEHIYTAPGTYHANVEVFVDCLEQRLPGTTKVDLTIVVTPAASTTTGP